MGQRYTSTHGCQCGSRERNRKQFPSQFSSQLSTPREVRELTEHKYRTRPLSLSLSIYMYIYIYIKKLDSRYLLMIRPMKFETQTSLLSFQSLLFFLFFVLVYAVAYFIVFRNWTSKTRPEASSCLISLFHGTPAVFLATRAILADPNRGFSSPNTGTQNSVLEFSIAYFLMDLVHYLIFCPGDVLFIGHHLATLFVFLTCRFLVHHGAYAILSLLVLAEVTSACQNAWTLAGARRFDAQFAARVQELLSPPFYGFYSVVRGCLGPYFVYQMGAFYMSGAADGVIPIWVWSSWLFVVVTAICVSILWITNLWVQLYRERNAKSDKKLK